MLIRDLFVSDVTRDIPPVVYFHEQSPEKLAAEVSEYIITGGWPEDHPNHRRVPQRHPRAVRPAADGHRRGARQGRRPRAAQRLDLRLLRLRQVELRQAPRPRPRRRRAPGRRLARGGVAARDTSPNAAELRAAWNALRQRVDPLAVVFDIGGVARDNEHIHAAAVRQVQQRLGYCAEPLVADFELRLERDGEWARFEEKAAGDARQAVGRREGQRAGRGGLLARPVRAVSGAVHRPDELVHQPRRHAHPFRVARGGRGRHPRHAEVPHARAPRSSSSSTRSPSTSSPPGPGGPAARLRDGPRRRAPRRGLAAGARAAEARRARRTTPSSSGRRTASPRACASTSRRRTSATSSTGGSSRSGPTPRSRSARSSRRNRPDLKLYAYGCESVTPEEFVEVYPMLPGQIDLILQITTALRTRSARAQGDDQAIRGLLQLLGELFRDQKPRRPAGRRAGHPRPDLRGAAHRARRRRAGVAWPAC